MSVDFFQGHCILSRAFIRWILSRPLAPLKTINQVIFFKTIYQTIGFFLVFYDSLQTVLLKKFRLFWAEISCFIAFYRKCANFERPLHVGVILWFHCQLHNNFCLLTEITYNRNNESDLIDHILRGYNRQARPIRDLSKPVSVSIAINLGKMLHLVRSSRYITTRCMFSNCPTFQIRKLQLNIA